MNKRGVIILGLFAGIGALAGGIYAFYRRQIYLAAQFCYKVHQVKPLDISKDLVKLEVKLKILNRSSFALKIKSYDIDIFLNNVKLSNVTSNKENIIAANAASYLTLQVSIDPKQFMSPSELGMLVTYFLTDRSKITLKVKGSLLANLNFINRTIPIDYQNTLEELMKPADPKEESERLQCPKNF